VQCYKCKQWWRHIKRDCPELNAGSCANVATHGDDLGNDREVLLVAGGVMESEGAA
jgi:hypothetical protein